MKKQQTFRPTTTCFAVAAALAALAQPVHADVITQGPITLEAEYSLGGGTTTGGLGDPAAQVWSTPGQGADFYLFKSDSANNNVFFHTYGFSGTNTYFGARSSGGGTFTAMSRASFNGSFTNTSSIIQAFNFGFHVDAGDIGVFGLGSGLADLLLRIRVNGTDVARDHTTITQTSPGVVSCASDDLGILGSYIDCSSPTSNSESDGGGLYNVFLGNINPGESFTLDYDIIATVSGNDLSNGTTTQIVCDGGYGGYGGQVDVATFVTDPYGGGTGTNCHEVQVVDPGFAIARSGDPFEAPIFDNQGNLINPPTGAGLNTTVPEPGTLALVALAAAGMGGLRRRRKAAR